MLAPLTQARGQRLVSYWLRFFRVELQ